MLPNAAVDQNYEHNFIWMYISSPIDQYTHKFDSLQNQARGLTKMWTIDMAGEEDCIKLSCSIYTK